jgi:hypothetical protein
MIDTKEKTREYVERIWNARVWRFNGQKSAGYGQYSLKHEDITAELVANRIEKAEHVVSHPTLQAMGIRALLVDDCGVLFIE